MFNFNDAPPQMGPMGEIIPDGTFAKLQLTIRPGGTDGAVPIDAKLLKASNTASSDVKMLDCEFTVVDGPFARRKFWQNLTVAGGKLDKNGNSMGWNITKSVIRAMIESALKLDPKDMSEPAKAKRALQGLSQLSGIVFAARVMVEPATSDQYSDQNRLANVVVPGEPQYDAIMAGQPVEPDPVNAKPRKAPNAGAAQTPGWNAQGGAPAAATSAPPPAASAAAAPAWLTA